MLQYVTPMLPLTPDELTEYDSPHVICHICKKHIEVTDVKCRDHDHLTGCYRGPSHQDCNLNYQIKPNKIQIPCFFHNLKNYDAHLLISAAQKRHGEISVIPTTTEKYISFTIGDVIFKDSLAFTQASLDTLTGNLTTDQLVNTRKWLENWVVQNGDSEHEEEEEEEEWEPNADDIMFIDDRQPSTSMKRRYIIIDSSDDDDDDDDNNSTPKHRRKEDQIRNHSSPIPPPPPVPFLSEESEDDDDDDDDDDMDEQIDFRVEYDETMVDYDYRRTPHQQPLLTDEQNQKIDDDLKLLKSKGIYPYEYMDSFDRFEERRIPPIEAFESSLKAGEGITVHNILRWKRCRTTTIYTFCRIYFCWMMF